ncbi:MAG: hypothetical protein OSA38_00780 [Candidatus Poseidoniaceae archaeon]|nr:hypothetical protein [Candidatus Poseidoniaceae archaeon]|tara:strand:- start:651 stop:932 length:282 start_codon:yes stop_codon:yes gene_type:complete
MEQVETKRNNTTMSAMLWYAIFIWFASSLFSQSLYMAFNGVPYDALMLLQDLGPLYYLVVGIEVAVWITLGVLLLKKIVQKTWFGNTTQPSMA